MVIMMVGGSAAHTIIKGNVFNALAARLRGRPCRALTEGLKVVTPVNVHYPDVAVICAPIEPLEEQIREPVVIVEVLSRTTGDRDRGAKWVGYRELPIAPALCPDRPGPTDAWRSIRATPKAGRSRSTRRRSQAVPLPAIGVELALDEIYEDSGC